jgi:DNA-directed RNA polymerase II subunit RPB2
MIYKITESMNSNNNTVTMDSKKDTDAFDIENDQFIEDPWHIIESYFHGQHLERLVRHQLESYNNFVSYQIVKTLEMFNPVRIVSEQDYDPVTKKNSLEVFVTLDNFNIYRPQIHENNGAIKLMFPQEARLRNFTYASAMTVDMNIKYVVRTGKELENAQTFYKTFPQIHIGKLPIMLKSDICVLKQYKHFNSEQTGECRFDTGGYFIINGSEKTVLGQERAAENRVTCYDVSKNNTKYHWVAEIKSVPDFKCISPKQINMMVSSKDSGFGKPIHVQLPRVKQPIPLFIVFRALGVLSDKDICKKILLDIENKTDTLKDMLNSLQASIIEANKYVTVDDCIKYITSFVMYTPINMDRETGAKKKLEFTMDILNNDLFPHCQNSTQKIYFLGYMTNKLLHAAFGLAKQDDRDSYLNKRVDLTGPLLNNLFRNYLNKMVKDMEKQIIREINTGSWKSTDDYENIINLTNIYKIIKSTTIENGIKRALATGDFGIKHTNSNKVGVAQVLNRLTYPSSLSHARRISTPTDKSGKLIPPRKLHNTTWGFCCPAETPEGQSVGLVKNVAYMAHITIYSNSTPLYEYIMPNIIPLDDASLDAKDMFNKVKVFINGSWVGITEKPEKLYTMLKENKYKGIINIYTSIIFDYKLMEIRVCNDAGRLTRPLLRVKDKNILVTKSIVNGLKNHTLKWEDLLTSSKLDDSVLEYIDAEEQSLSLIATRPKDIIAQSDKIYHYTHCEIHPSTIFGILASCIPFPEHNQSPRNSYQCLDMNEYVLMSDGNRKALCDVVVGDEVVSFHPETFETSITKVTHHYVRKTDKKIYKLKTISGREIIATEDHKFMTSTGWVQVKDMIEGNTKIGVYTQTDENAKIKEYERIKISYDINEIITKKNSLFITVSSITEVENRLISDITVESENHSFIAGNNFLSSNCAQGKQAMGVYVTNYENRMDKTAYVLNYPTRPLVDTRIMNMIQLNKIPSGTNIIVAIMTHTGYNQEDSLLVNKGSIDRGLFMTTIYHTEKDEDKQKINGDEEIRCKPDATKTKGMKIGNYSKVNSRGVIPENTIVENRDVIIAKVTPIKENRNDPTKVIKYEDQSKIYRTTEETYIDKNYIDRNGEGYNFAKVKLRTVRKPVIGDKCSSRHGQKGTIGNIIPECDMPFTRAGVKPDLIINPHAIPSRMTIAQLKETVLGKVLLELGLFGDGTSFGEFDVKDICSELLKVGYESNGNELMYNGLTGEQVEYSVFIGPVFYQRLKHMVNDKVHSRAIGPMVNLTRQPAEGRSRDGGLRFGEMERDCFMYHTPIPLNNGLSVKIGEMNECDDIVFGWDETTKLMVPSKQTGFLDKGERECFDITFQDGRKITCTEEHPLLTSAGEWMKTKDIVVGETRMKTSITCPLIDMNEEIDECNDWELNIGNDTLFAYNKEEYLKSMAFARIIGYLIMDGTITKTKNAHTGTINLGHMIDVERLLTDIRMFCEIKQTNFVSGNYYSVRIPIVFLNNIIQLPGITIGRKVNQPAELPEFIMDTKCPKPIVREFLAAMFGADGHTCYLGMHRGKRDLLTSISFSKTRTTEHLDSLKNMMDNIKQLFARFDIQQITIQNVKETSSSKAKAKGQKLEGQEMSSYQMTLHLDIDELIPFSEKIGFRYCCHKSQRLEAGVSYKRLRTEVVRQHNWLTNRVDEITNFKAIKSEQPDKIVHTQKAIEQAVKDLKQIEPLIHSYAIPSTHDITDHLIKGTKFGKFGSKSFPTAEQFMIEIGAIDWFLNHDDVDALDVDMSMSSYGVAREQNGLPTMNLKVIDIRPAGVHPVYDIEVENTHSFLANGIVAHNCMISHGASRFTKGRMYDSSDKYSVHVCKKCGQIASFNDKMHIHHCRMCDNRVDFAYVEIPYACKLLFQELNTMNVVPRIMTE